MREEQRDMSTSRGYHYSCIREQICISKVKNYQVLIILTFHMDEENSKVASHLMEYGETDYFHNSLDPVDHLNSCYLAT